MQELIVLFAYSTASLNDFSGNIPFYAWYLLILTKNLADHHSMAAFTSKMSSCLLFLIKCM